MISDWLNGELQRSVRPENSLSAKVKQSHYRPRKALRAPEGRGSQVFRQSAHDGVKVVSPTQPAAFTPQERFLVIIAARS
jgi:hypothetical protein